uniref:Uncharacterized protein n=1 Tax=Alexandrium catenella TaxID=2925 RepID=A0A7S1WM78_ALECA|mmetsp:Transcript_73752/g.196005  ORF Transcript_73752/g.196005 Transcript_73752/m.196005 type:complete len:473 (+) Transcript_73752:105-1523(+)
MAPCAAAAKLLFVLPLAAARRETFDLEADMGSALQQQECGREGAEPGKPLQQYFDGLRQKYGILQGSGHFLGEDGLQDPARCTKKDVCLLMRQLDMDFFARARDGLLQDIDYEVPPTKAWVVTGNCDGQEKIRGFNMKPVLGEDTCERQARKKGLTFAGEAETGPHGCFARDSGKGMAVYLNTAASSETAGTKGKVKTEILCEMDRSLTESGSVYYSPYKLKPSMLGDEGRSTSCSYGMYAFLAKLRETKSPCAKILAYQTHQKFKSAQEALDMAAKLEGDGNTNGAEKLRQYVESVRQKYVLVDAVANSWCPGIWTASMAEKSRGTCSTPRLPKWTKESQKMTEATQATTQKAVATDAKSVKKHVAKPKPKGRLANAMDKAGQEWDLAGNQALLTDVSELLATLKAEDEFAESLTSAKDSDEARPEQMDSQGKPIKIALTEDACANVQDQSLAELLKGKSQAPKDFFEKAM